MHFFSKQIFFYGINAVATVKSPLIYLSENQQENKREAQIINQQKENGYELTFNEKELKDDDFESF